MIGMSKLIAAGATGIPSGASSAVKPSTASKLKILLPTALPTAMSRSPRAPATADVASSGNDVPIAMMVSPMTSWLRPKASAMAVAPWTSHSEPLTRRYRPPKIMAPKPANRCRRARGGSASSPSSRSRCSTLARCSRRDSRIVHAV